MQKRIIVDRKSDIFIIPKTDKRKNNLRKNLVEEYVQPISEFLKWMENELKAEPVFQPLFDSRALEKLPTIERELKRLTKELTNACEIGSKYAEHIVNQSGAIDINISELMILSEAVGRDKVTNIYNRDSTSKTLYSHFPPNKS